MHPHSYHIWHICLWDRPTDSAKLLTCRDEQKPLHFFTEKVCGALCHGRYIGYIFECFTCRVTPVPAAPSVYSSAKRQMLRLFWVLLLKLSLVHSARPSISTLGTFCCILIFILSLGFYTLSAAYEQMISFLLHM